MKKNLQYYDRKLERILVELTERIHEIVELIFKTVGCTYKIYDIEELDPIQLIGDILVRESHIVYELVADDGECPEFFKDSEYWEKFPLEFIEMSNQDIVMQIQEEYEGEI